MSIYVRTALAAVLAPAAALGALWGADQAGFAGGGGAITAAPAQAVAPEAQLQPSRYDLFSPPAADNAAAAVNSACGFAPSLTGGGSRIWFAGDPAEGVMIDSARDGAEGEDGALTRYTARADAVHAFAQDGELFVQAGHADRDGLEGRVWLLDAGGEPTFSGPVMARGRVALACQDAQGAANLLNAALASAGGPADPVRAAVRAFEIGDGVPEWDHPRVDAFVSACTPDAALADMPAAAPFVLMAQYDADARFGDSIVHEMSGESLGGSPEPMVYVTLANLTNAPNYGYVRTMRIPISWSDLVRGDDAVTLIFRFEAIESRQWLIESNGARAHGMGADALSSVRLACADPEAGAAALEAVRDQAETGAQ